MARSPVLDPKNSWCVAGDMRTEVMVNFGVGGCRMTERRIGGPSSEKQNACNTEAVEPTEVVITWK
jgi:hypothetical protein